MARITSMPSEAQISGFKGIIDYYVYKGINCVRRWPSKPSVARIPSVQAQWPIFGYVNQMLGEIDPDIIDAYKALAVGTDYAWKDVMVKAYIDGQSNFLPPGGE